jgi:hypothetical protein
MLLSPTAWGSALQLIALESCAGDGHLFIMLLTAAAAGMDLSQANVPMAFCLARPRRRVLHALGPSPRAWSS